MSDVREQDRRRFSFISLMEGAILLALGGLTTMVFQTREAVIKLTVQQEASQQLLTNMQTGLADVPAIRTRMAEMKVQMDQNKQDIAELRQMRGLK